MTFTRLISKNQHGKRFRFWAISGLGVERIMVSSFQIQVNLYICLVAIMGAPG